MPKTYEIEIYETWVSTAVVEADSLEEAILKYQNGEADFPGECEQLEVDEERGFGGIRSVNVIDDDTYFWWEQLNELAEAGKL